MILADLFHAMNAAGVRLTKSGDRVQIRTVGGAVTPEIIAGVKEHKQALLDVLPTADDIADEADARAERMAIIAEANGMTTSEQLAEAVLEWDRVAVLPRIDPQTEWLQELAVMYLRWADCTNQDVRDRLQPLLEHRPADSSGCNAIIAKMRQVEHELREAGQLPSFHWPNDIPPVVDIDLDLLTPMKETNLTKEVAEVATVDL